MNATLSRPAPQEHMGPCSYCGQNWGSTHSGRYECGDCWNMLCRNDWYLIDRNLDLTIPKEN